MAVLSIWLLGIRAGGNKQICNELPLDLLSVFGVSSSSAAISVNVSTG